MVTLEESKSYLRIDFEDDDVFIGKLIKASEQYIKNTVSDYESNELVDIVQLLLIQHWYYNRSLMGKRIFKSISLYEYIFVGFSPIM